MKNQAIGKSKFVIATLASIIFGIFLGDIIHIDLWWLGGIALGILLVLIFEWYEQYYRLGLLILFGFAIGLGFMSYYALKQSSIKLPFGKEIEIQGQVIRHPDYLAAESRYIIAYQNTKIQVTTGRYPEYHYGDILKFKGKIIESYPYFYHQGILGQIYNPEKLEKVGYSGNKIIATIYNVRDKFENALNMAFSEPNASFAAGLLLGSKRNIPDSLMSDFNRTGTTHIIAVSGYNVTIIITYIGLILGIFSRRLRFWGSLLAIIGFVIMTGAAASVVRAGILVGLIIFGKAQGRRINMLILILLVGVVMLLFNPYALKYDLSFQLSFLAFAGLVWLGPIFSQTKPFKYLPKLLNSTLSETLAAQILVLPILIISFGRISLVAPIVNVLILWLIPTAMLLVFLTGLSTIIYYPLGLIISYLGYIVLKYILTIVERFSSFSWASFDYKNSSWWWLPLYFIILFIVIWRFKLLSSLDKNQDWDQ